MNILEVLKNYKKNETKSDYGEGQPLHTNDTAVTSYAESSTKSSFFLLPKVEIISTFEKMMDDLFLFCKKTRT